jgi:hypothetical protein
MVVQWVNVRGAANIMKKKIVIKKSNIKGPLIKSVKKAQSGTSVDKTAVKKPTGTAIVRNKPAYTNSEVFFPKLKTKQDSTEYKKGFDYGKDHPERKLQSIVESPTWTAGNYEGRDDKRSQKKIKYQSGGKVVKTTKLTKKPDLGPEKPMKVKPVNFNTGGKMSYKSGGKMKKK